MILRVINTEVENFRGKHPAVQIITLSRSYAEVLAAYRDTDGNFTVRILRPEPFDTSGHLAHVKPPSAPAMLTIPLSKSAAVQVGDQLTLSVPDT